MSGGTTFQLAGDGVGGSAGFPTPSPPDGIRSPAGFAASRFDERFEEGDSSSPHCAQ